MMDSLPDATLVARARTEDRDAYAALVRRYQDVAFRTADDEVVSGIFTYIVVR